MLKPGLPPQLLDEVIRALNEYQSAIIKAGEVTQQDHKSNVHYVNIIFEINHLVKELKDANRN